MLPKSRLSSVISRLSVFVCLFVAGAGNLLAAGDGGAHHDELPLFAEEVVRIGPIPITNSMIMV